MIRHCNSKSQWMFFTRQTWTSTHLCLMCLNCVCTSGHLCKLTDCLIESMSSYSPWRRCHKTLHCCWWRVCWDKPVRRTERQRRPDLSLSSRCLCRCSATPWGSWSSLCLSLPSSWTWLWSLVHLPSKIRQKSEEGERKDEVAFFLSSLATFLVELWSRRDMAREVHLCVKIMTVRKAETDTGFADRKLTVRRDSCCPVGAAGWRWIWSLVHNVNSSLSRVVVRGAHEGMAVTLRSCGKSTPKQKYHAFPLKWTITDIKCLPNQWQWYTVI